MIMKRLSSTYATSYHHVDELCSSGRIKESFHWSLCGSVRVFMHMNEYHLTFNNTALWNHVTAAQNVLMNNVDSFLLAHPFSTILLIITLECERRSCS